MNLRRAVLDTFDSRLRAVERTSQQHDDSLLFLHGQMQRLANDLNIDAAQRYTIAAPVIEMPPLQGQVSRRVQTVTRLLERTAHSTWIAVHGPIGSGKTTLAILLAQAIGTCRAWLGMRGLTMEQACQRLDTVCREPSSTSSQARADRYEIFCRGLGAGSLLVLGAGSLLVLVVIASMGERVITHLLLADRFDDAMGVALDIGPAYQAIQEERQRGIDARGVKLPIEDLLGPPPGRPWRLASFRSALAGLVPVAFHLSTVALEQPDRARADARVVASLCRQISGTQVNQQLWIAAADVLDMIEEGNAGVEGLMRWGRERQGEFDFVLQLISYLSATWQPDALQEQVAAIHLHLLPMLANKGILPQLAYRRVVLPYILRYWSAAFRRERFRFRGPKLVEEELRAHERLPLSRQAQAILRTVAYSLGISVPPDTHRWFQEAAQSEL